MRFTAAEQRAKLAKLTAIEGYDSIEELASASFKLRPPAICMNEDCDFTCDWSPIKTPGSARSAAPTRCNPP
jgi:hypothetical protein